MGGRGGVCTVHGVKNPTYAQWSRRHAVCVCVCVCGGGGVCVCVCVCVCVN